MSDLDVQVRSMLAEAGIHEQGSEELVRLLAGLDATYVDDAVPEPGPALAVLLGGGEAPLAKPRRPRGRRAAATGLVALGVVASSGWAAAANELPRPAQRWVADFSQRYLPFDLPYPQPVTPAGAPEPESEHKGGSSWVDAHDARPVVERDAGGGSTFWRRDASGDDSDADVDERYSGDSETSSGEGWETDPRDEREDATQEWGQEAEEDSGSETPAPPRQSAEESETEDVESSDGADGGDGYAEPASDAPEESSDD